MANTNLKAKHKIYLGQSSIPNAGRGIFAGQPITKGELIESCPIIYLSQQDYKQAKQTSLRNYYFLNKNQTRCAIALGYGSLYNHSFTPNATYQKQLEQGFINFIAIQDIAKDQEITVNYNYGNPDDKTKLWIEQIESYKE